MQLYFIRHSQSENNALYDATASSQGRSDDPRLTEIGLEQARLLGQYLAAEPRLESVSGRDPQNLGGFGITHMYCSLMQRSIQTATFISEATGIPAVAWIDIHEEGGMYREDEETGELVGLPGVKRAWLAEHFPNLVLPNSMGEDGWWNQGFEIDADRPVRAQRFLQELMQRHRETEDRVAVVSHGGFYNQVMHAVLERTPDRGTWFVMNNSAISRIDFVRSMAIVYMNRVEHLPAKLIT